jgi:quinol monooxygenase YgiN
MQFGSVFRMKPKPGQKQAVIDHLLTRRELKDVDGFLAAYVYDSGDELWGAAVFRDEKAYRDNANDPEQNKSYEKLRAMLEVDPEWHDGTVQSLT